VRRLPTLLIFSLIFFLNISNTVSAEDTGLLLKDYSNIPAQKVILDNGFAVVLKETSSSGLISLDARVKAGSAYEGEFAGSGISHFVEHMIFKGTSKRRPADIEREIRSLGGTINGATTYDYTAFTITLPKEHLSYALEVLSDSLFNATMNPKELERERGVILKEIKLNKDDPVRLISRLLWSSVFKTHPYKHPIIGHEKLFRKVTQKDVLKYYKRMYVPNNMVLVVAGDIETRDALNEVKKYFQNTERAAFEELALPQERSQVAKRVLDVERPLEMAYFALGYRSIDVHDPDMPALDVLSVLLGQGESSRLNSSLYRKKNLVYSIGCWNYTPLDPGIFIISGVAEPEKLNTALVAIDEEINNVTRDGAEEDELERAKAMIIADHIYSLGTVSSQAGDLASNEIFTGDFDFTRHYLEDIDSVTQVDIKRVARLYLNDDGLSVVTLSPRIEKAIPKTKGEKSRREIQKFTLPNGLRCLLMEDHDLPTVSMIAACLGGLRAESKETSGISNLTSLMMLKGTSSRSEEEISTAVEDIGANLSFFSGNNTLGIRFELLSKDIAKALELFEDIIQDPSFPPDVLQREKETVMASIKATTDNIFEAGMKRFKENLFTKHPYRFQAIGTIKSVNTLTKEDLEDFYKRSFRPDNMVLGFYGDFDAQKLKEKISNEFSALKNGERLEFTTIIEPEQVDIRQNQKIEEKEQSLVVLGFKGAQLKGKDRYTLQLISTALSGISGRLSSRLREKLGIAYAVGSFSVPAFDPGYFAMYISTTNDNIERAKNEFFNQIKLLNKKGLGPDEIEAAKKELIGNHRIALQTNAAFARHTALDELYNLGYNHYLEYDKIIGSITNADVIDASRRYLRPSAYTLITIVGKKGG